ncbi:MAG: hypothetical protein U0736_25495 [Gemmataceae bacterium]
MKARSRRCAFTLFETILVCGVLLLVAAFTVPSLRSMYGYYKLQGGVDTVRAGFARARQRAIEEGRPYRFAIEPDGSHVRIAPDRPDYCGGGGASGDGIALVQEDALPGGVRFNLNGAPAGADTDVSDKPDAATPSSGNWTPAAVFLPDGTAREDVHLHFQIRGVRPTVLHMRGLTGNVTVQSVSR